MLEPKPESVAIIDEEIVARPSSAAVSIPSRKPLFSRNQLRVWGVLSTLSLIDQGLTSGAGFGVNLLLARWMTAEGYGAFALAFGGFLFIAGFHNILLLEPVSVFGPARYAHKLPVFFRAQVAIHFVLVGPLCASALLTGLLLWRITPGSPLVGAAIGCGLSLPFLLLLWLARRMCYVVQRPSIAVTGSALYLVFVVLGQLALRYLGHLGPFTAFLLMGASSAVSAGLLLGRLGLLKSELVTQGSVPWRLALRENWSYGRWLVGSAVLFSISSQAQAFIAATFLGLGAAGILRAMQLPSLVMTQVVTATGLLFLPVFSRDFGLGAIVRMLHKATLVSVGLMAVALFFAGGLALSAAPLERLLFGGKYSDYAWLIPLLALIPVVNGLSTGCSMALRAAQKPQFDFISNVFAAPVALISGLALVRGWGLPGAAASMLLGFSVLSVVTLVFFRQAVQTRALSNAGDVLP